MIQSLPFFWSFCRFSSIDCFSDLATCVNSQSSKNIDFNKFACTFIDFMEEQIYGGPHSTLPYVQTLHFYLNCKSLPETPVASWSPWFVCISAVTPNSYRDQIGDIHESRVCDKDLRRDGCTSPSQGVAALGSLGTGTKYSPFNKRSKNMQREKGSLFNKCDGKSEQLHANK